MEKELLSLLQNFIIETRTAREIQTREHQEQMQKLAKKIDEMDRKFEKRFAEMDQKFEKRFAEMDQKFEKRFAVIDSMFAEQDSKFNMLLRNQDIIVLRLDALSEDVAELKRANGRPPVHLATTRLKNNT